MRYKTQRQQEKNYVALKKAGDIKHQKRERERTPNIKKYVILEYLWVMNFV